MPTGYFPFAVWFGCVDFTLQLAQIYSYFWDGPRVARSRKKNDLNQNSPRSSNYKNACFIKSKIPHTRFPVTNKLSRRGVANLLRTCQRHSKLSWHVKVSPNKSATSRYNVIWETTWHNSRTFACANLLRTCYRETYVVDFGLYYAAKQSNSTSNNYCIVFWVKSHLSVWSPLHGTDGHSKASVASVAYTSYHNSAWRCRKVKGESLAEENADKEFATYACVVHISGEASKKTSIV